MTSLQIIPKWKDKTARFKGTIAAGEHVAVSIANDDGYITDTTNLRLRVVNPANGKTLAQFPMPEVLPTAALDDETSETEEMWDGTTTLTCELNLNTDRMLMAVPPAANVPLLFVLDAYEGATDEDEGEFTLYFKDFCDVTHWPRRRGEDEPTRLDDYKDIIADFREDIYGDGGFKDRVESAESAAQSAAGSARLAEEHAGNSESGARAAMIAAQATASLATASAIGKMRERTGNRLWHNVALSMNIHGKWVMDVDQEPGDNDGNFDAKVLALGTTTPRSLASRFADVIHAKDFGAAGDGLTDDTVAINAAINAAQNYETVSLDNGIYKVSSLTINKPIDIYGGTIVGDGSSEEVVVIDIPYEDVHGDSLATKCGSIENVVVDASATGCGTGIRVMRARGFRIEDCLVKNAPDYGIRIAPDQGSLINEVYVSDTWILSDQMPEGVGISCETTDCSFNSIVIQGYKKGVFNNGGNNRFCQVHGWTVVTNAASASNAAVTTFLTDSVFFETRRNAVLVACTSDSYAIAVKVSDSIDDSNDDSNEQTDVSGVVTDVSGVVVDGLYSIHNQFFPVAPHLFHYPRGIFKLDLFNISGLNVHSALTDPNKIEFSNIASSQLIPGYYENNIDQSYAIQHSPTKGMFISGIGSGNYKRFSFYGSTGSVFAYIEGEIKEGGAPSLNFACWNNAKGAYDKVSVADIAAVVNAWKDGNIVTAASQNSTN